MTRIDVLALGYGIDVTWPVLLFWPLFFFSVRKKYMLTVWHWLMSWSLPYL